MSGSTFGKIFQLTTFGESHGIAMGGIIQGCPSGIELDIDQIQKILDRRKPGQSPASTPRIEKDKVQFLSGIYEGKTTGTPIGFLIENTDQKPEDYRHISKAYRPSHADLTYEQKYGLRDPRGGGRSSARETVCRVVGGAIAEIILNKIGISFLTYVDQIGEIRLTDECEYSFSEIESSILRCPDPKCTESMLKSLEEAKSEGDTLGGCIRGVINGVPPGMGEPVFDKLHAELGKAMLSINAVKGFEIGSGFASSKMKGSQHNDIFSSDFTTKTNHSGGIQGGISNGMPITFRVAFKPVATLMKDQTTVNSMGESVILEGKGRHDVCVVPRAVPIVQAMAAMVILDGYLLNKRLTL